MSASGRGQGGHFCKQPDKTEFKVTPEQVRAAITPRTRLFILQFAEQSHGSL